MKSILLPRVINTQYVDQRLREKGGQGIVDSASIGYVSHAIHVSFRKGDETIVDIDSLADMDEPQLHNASWDLYNEIRCRVGKEVTIVKFSFDAYLLMFSEREEKQEEFRIKSAWK